MATLNFIPGKLLIGADLLLSMSGCALHQHKHKPFLSIQTNFIKENPLPCRRSDQSAGIHGQCGSEASNRWHRDLWRPGVATVLSLGVVRPVYAVVRNLEQRLFTAKDDTRQSSALA